MPKIVHFELPFDDADRANQFYAQVFGWQSRKWDGPEEYYLQETGTDAEPYGIGGALIARASAANGGGALGGHRRGRPGRLCRQSDGRGL